MYKNERNYILMIKKLISFFCLISMCTVLLTVFSHGVELSSGLNVLRARVMLTKTVCNGQTATFTDEDFAAVSGCDGVETITIVSIPEADDGILRFGSLSVFPGQVISQRGISSLEYEPVGEMGQFTYRLNDEKHETVCRVYCLSEGKEAPSAKSMKLSGMRNIAVFDSIRSENGSDDDVYRILSQPKRGLLSVSSDGSFKYTPSDNYTGVDSFVYKIVDKYGNESKQATVTLKIRKPDTDIVYSDMSDHYAASAALRLAEKDILIGEKLGETAVFFPDKSVSRLEFLVMAMKAAGYSPNINSSRKTLFADDAEIPSAQKGYVISACISGLIDDDENTKFEANKPITYGEAAMITAKLLELKSESVSVFFPNRFTSHDAVQALADNDLTIYSDPDAQDVMSRADTALLLENIIKD